MGLNIKIIDRINELDADETTKKILQELLLMEANDIGHYKKRYKEILKTSVEGIKGYENN